MAQYTTIHVLYGTVPNVGTGVPMSTVPVPVLSFTFLLYGAVQVLAVLVPVHENVTRDAFPSVTHLTTGLQRVPPTVLTP